jgi:hypothetical protein
VHAHITHCKTWRKSLPACSFAERCLVWHIGRLADHCVIALYFEYYHQRHWGTIVSWSSLHIAIEPNHWSYQFSVCHSLILESKELSKHCRNSMHAILCKLYPQTSRRGTQIRCTAEAGSKQYSTYCDANMSTRWFQSETVHECMQVKDRHAVSMVFLVVCVVDSSTNKKFRKGRARLKYVAARTHAQ